MAKHSLKKLYHISTEEYKKEYELRFNADDTIHFNINIGNNQAFLCQTSDMMKLIVSIERTDKQIDRLYGQLPFQAINQFANRCLIDEIVLSNNIEGVHSTRKEINAILNDLSENNRRQRFYGLVNKYKHLFSGDVVPMQSCQDIRNIYDDIFLEEIKSTDPDNVPDGKIFRKSSVSVYSATGKEIHKGLNPESNIIDVMNKSLEILKDENIDVLIRIALFHYLFGYIHPFYDGNGRTSRFISSYLLSQELNHLIGYRISYTIKEHLKDYYKSFEVCNHPLNKGDLTPFVEMFLWVIDESQKQLCSALRKRVVALQTYAKILDDMFKDETPIMSKLYYVLIQASLFSDLGISLKDLEHYMDISYNTLHKLMAKVPDDLLVKNKQNKLLYLSINLEEIDKFVQSQE